MNIHGVIYGLHDPESGELRYIGQTIKSIPDRLAAHLSPSSLRRHSYLYRWLGGLVKRGLKPTWTQIDAAETQADLDRLEIEHIARARLYGVRLVNLSDGGGGRSGYVPSEEEREKIASKQRGVPRQPKTPEQKEHMAQLMAGRCTNTPEHMAKLAEAKRGVSRPQEVRNKISEAKKGQPSPNKGIPMPDAVKAKVAASRKGKLKGSTHHQYRHDISTDAILQKLASGQSKVEIAEELGVSPTFVHRRLNQAGRTVKPEVPMDLVLQRLTEGATLRAVSEEVGFPYMTVWRRVQQHRKAA